MHDMDPTKRAMSDAPRYRSPRRKHIYDAIDRAAANGGGGWAYYADGARLTRAQALPIAAGARTAVPIDGLGPNQFADLKTIASAASPLLRQGRVWPVQLLDLYLVRFGFRAALTNGSGTGAASVLIEYRVSDTVIPHSDRRPFLMDPGPVRDRVADLTASRTVLGGILGAVLTPITSRLTALTTLASTVQGTQDADGELFVTQGIVFVGPPTLAAGISLTVTPTHAISLWAPDVLVSRISSPTT